MYAYSWDAMPLRRRRARPRWKVGVRQAVFASALVVILGFSLAKSVQGSSPSGYDYITVKPGDTLWAIAARRYPGADVRDKVGEIEAENRLSGPILYAGEQLKIPAS